MEIVIPKGFDAHVHFRQGDTLKTSVPATAKQFSKALVMPNLQPAIRTPNDVYNYRLQILEAHKENYFEPLMTFKIYPDTDPKSLKELKSAMAIAGKVYPQGLTTNAEDGVKDYFALFPIFAEMEKNWA